MDVRWQLRQGTTRNRVPAVGERLPVERPQGRLLGLPLVVPQPVPRLVLRLGL